MIPRPRFTSSDQGWVMVPVMALLAITLALGLALLVVVDTQTSQGRTQRTSDSAQTLAEGLVTATANTLAANASFGAVPAAPNACESITGNLTTTPTGSTTSLAYRLTTEIMSRFGGGSGSTSEYVSSSRSATWKVTICQVQGSESRWSDAFLTRPRVPPATSGPLSLWVRAQASVRNGANTSTPVRSRAVASKIKQATYPFVPPSGFAVGTGSFTTDLSTGLDTVLTNTSGLVGTLTTKVLGTGSTPLIASSSSKIGVRCGLLDTLSHVLSPCLGGTIAGLSQTTQALNLGVLNTLLGTNRTESLGYWTMAPADAVAAWKAEAQTSGVYHATVSGSGSTVTKSASAAPACLSASDVTTAKVVYIGQVGTGDQYCTLNGAANQNSAKIFIVEKGGVRITGAFTGIVYALNKQECTNADGTCSTADHNNAAQRELVRIEGTTGKVTGQVWVDGAGGAVGIYPSASPITPTQSDLINAIGGASGICSTANLNTVLNNLQSTLNGVGQIVGLLVGTRQTRWPGGAATQPDKCTLLKTKLQTMTVAQLESLYQNGGSVTITISEHRTCSLLSLLGACIGTWSASPGTPVSPANGYAVDSQDMTTLNIPPLLTDATLVGQLATVLNSALGASSYSAITYDSAAPATATANIATGAGPVIGTYRNVSPN